DVEGALRDGAGELLESMRLFDVYAGEQVGEGRKSLAFSLRFRAAGRTLTDAEGAEARRAAIEAASLRTGGARRGAAGGAWRRRGRAAGVDAAVRRLRRRAGGRGAQVARVLPAVPRRRTHADRR